MTAAEIIRDVHYHGGEVTGDGSDLALSASRPLPAELLHELRTHKSELLAHLTIDCESPVSATDTIADPNGACSTCGGWQWWQTPGDPWHCRSCRTMTDAENAKATTLTGGPWEPSA